MRLRVGQPDGDKMPRKVALQSMVHMYAVISLTTVSCCLVTMPLPAVPVAAVPIEQRFALLKIDRAWPAEHCSSQRQ